MPNRRVPGRRPQPFIPPQPVVPRRRRVPDPPLEVQEAPPRVDDPWGIEEAVAQHFARPENNEPAVEQNVPGVGGEAFNINLARAWAAEQIEAERQARQEAMVRFGGIPADRVDPHWFPANEVVEAHRAENIVEAVDIAQEAEIHHDVVEAFVRGAFEDNAPAPPEPDAEEPAMNRPRGVGGGLFEQLRARGFIFENQRRQAPAAPKAKAKVVRKIRADVETQAARQQALRDEHERMLRNPGRFGVGAGRIVQEMPRLQPRQIIIDPQIEEQSSDYWGGYRYNPLSQTEKKKVVKKEQPVPFNAEEEVIINFEELASEYALYEFNSAFPDKKIEELPEEYSVILEKHITIITKHKSNKNG